jgi:diguanylate cyclase
MLPDRPIELGLARPDEGTRAAVARLADRLLELLGEQTVLANGLPTGTYLDRLAGFRSQLDDTLDDERAVTRLTDGCTSASRDFVKRAGAATAERETELKGLIETLTSAIERLAGEAVSVNAELTNRTHHFNRLQDVEDIRDLKRQISDEVSALNRFITEKQEREDAYYAKLNKRIEVLQSRLAETEQAASIDQLTQVPNRGTFDRALRRWLSRLSQTPFVLALVDIDNFKQVNDTYGHLVGDRVLLATARMLSSAVRPNDMVARFGGEEFVILLAGANLRQAEGRMKELLAQIAGSAYEFEHNGQREQLSYTVSAGIAEATSSDTSDTLLKRADDGLYEAKHRGKNCVVAKRSSLFSRVLG